MERDFRVELKEILENAKREITKAVEETNSDIMFRDLAPVKKLAQNAAREEITGFKKNTNDQIKEILSSIGNSKKEILVKVESEVEGTQKKFKGEILKLLDATKGELVKLMDKGRVEAERAFAELKNKRGPPGDPGEPGISPNPDDIAKAAASLISKPKDGDPGQDKESDKPEEIAKKLNTLGGVVRQTVIIGLEDRLNDLKRSILRAKGSKGGGMSTLQHESFSVSSSTTSITVASSIAANGLACWISYQGGTIARGTHWTSARSGLISLLFTPDDSPTIDVIYFST